MNRPSDETMKKLYQFFANTTVKRMTPEKKREILSRAAAQATA